MSARMFSMLCAVLLVLCAMALVTSQHRSRSLFVDLERAQQRSRELMAEGVRLRIELGRAAQPAAIEAAARGMGMRPLEPSRTVLIAVPVATAEAKK